MTDETVITTQGDDMDRIREQKAEYDRQQAEQSREMGAPLNPAPAPLPPSTQTQMDRDNQIRSNANTGVSEHHPLGLLADGRLDPRQPLPETEFGKFLGHVRELAIEAHERAADIHKRLVPPPPFQGQGAPAAPVVLSDHTQGVVAEVVKLKELLNELIVRV